MNVLPRRRSAKTVDDSPVPVTFARGGEIGLSGGPTNMRQCWKEIEIEIECATLYTPSNKPIKQ